MIAFAGGSNHDLSKQSMVPTQVHAEYAASALLLRNANVHLYAVPELFCIPKLGPCITSLHLEKRNGIAL